VVVNDPEDKESAIDKQFSRARVIVSAIAVAFTIAASFAGLVNRIQLDLSDLHVEHGRDIGDLRACVKGLQDTLAERGIRIANLEDQVYELRNKTSARKDPFTGTEGKELSRRLELLERLENIEHQSPPGQTK
jgi:hypothetical protein